MKRLILAVLPILLAAQIPLSVTNLVPSDVKRSFHFGVKWTGLLLSSFWNASNDEVESDAIPAGVVTTTVVLASIPQFDQEIQIAFEKEICKAQVEFAQKTAQAVRIQKEFNKKYRIIQYKSKTIQL